MVSDNAIVQSPLRRLIGIALTGVLCVLAVLAGGRIAERVVLGPDETSTRAKIDSNLRGAFDVMSQGLRVMARQLANPDEIAAAAREDAAAAKLFVSAQSAAAARTPDVELAITAYSVGGQPLAWAGRPSELPRDRLEGDEAWFI